MGFVWVWNFTGIFGWLDLVRILILGGIRSKQYGGSYYVACDPGRVLLRINTTKLQIFLYPVDTIVLQLVKSHHPLRYSDSDTHADVTRGTSYNKIFLFH